MANVAKVLAIIGAVILFGAGSCFLIVANAFGRAPEPIAIGVVLCAIAVGIVWWVFGRERGP